MKKKIYRIKIEVSNGGVAKGHLIALGDSSLFSVRDIKKLSLMRRGAVRRGFATGVAIGMGAGFILGYATHTPPTCSGKGVCLDFGPTFSGLIAGFLAGGAGGLVGIGNRLGYRHFLIDGDKTTYLVFRHKMLNGPRSTLAKTPKVIL